MMRKRSRALDGQKYIVLLVAIALFLLFFSVSEGFRRYTTFVSLLDYSYYVVLMAVGVAFPLLTGGVDLSVGTGMVCYALLGGVLIRNCQWPVAAAILVTIAAGTLVGAVNGVLIAYMRLPAFLATLCTCMIARGIGAICSSGYGIPWPTVKQPEGWFRQIFKITAMDGTKVPIGFLWVILIVLIMDFVLFHTRFGRYIISIGSNAEAAKLSGIPIASYHFGAYLVSGFFVGLAATAYAAVIPTVSPGTGAGLELDAIGGAILGGVSATGGVGSISGAFIGVMVIVLLRTGLPFIGLQANWQQIITGIVLITAVMIEIIKCRRRAET